LTLSVIIGCLAYLQALGGWLERLSAPHMSVIIAPSGSRA
jgi:hypothetical protein